MAIIRLQGEEEKRKGIYFQLDTADEPIGAGGMGQVFKGICVNTQTHAVREVAIKFMYDDLPAHAIERGRREASIQLRNDNLIEMLGFIEIEEKTALGDTRKHYHIVSELLTGVSLSDIMEGKTTDRNGEEVAYAVKLVQDYKNDSEHFARTVVLQVLSGLMALHDAGFIHRDIDPSNIMVTKQGHIKLIDFGIAKQMNTLTTSDKSLTTVGEFMGKAEYASPELVLGDVRHQNQTTDIYAMGILLYQCITGHTPFEGPRHEVLENQLKAKLPLSPNKNKALRRIITKACEKRQELRFQTSAQMRVALETMTVSSNNKTMQYIAAAVFAVIVGGTVALLMQKTDNPVTPDPELTGIAKATKLMSSPETAKDGFQILNELVNSNDAEATYLASRLYLGRMPEEYCPDSTRNMYLMLQNANCIEADYEKAHQLLEKAVALDSMNYQGLYELGRDVLAGNNRQHDVDLQQEDFVKANDLFQRALKYAKEKQDYDYIERIEKQIESIKDVL